MPAMKPDLSQTKAVDENGEPLLLYRGEYGPVDGNPGGFQSKRGSYSFGDTRIASIYAVSGTGRLSCSAEDAAPRIFPVYLDIRNPVVNWADLFIEYPQLLEAVGAEWAIKLLIRHEYHVYNTNNWVERIDPDGLYGDVATLVKMAPHLVEDLYLDIYPVLDDADFVEIAKSRGFDGAIYNGTGQNLLTREYRIFDQAQAIFALTGERATLEIDQKSRPTVRSRFVAEVETSPGF